GDDQQSLLRVFGLPHFADAEIDRVQQSGSTLRDVVNQLALDIFDGLSEVGNFLRLMGEGDHEELILRVGSLEDLHHSFACPLDFAAHATLISKMTPRDTGASSLEKCLISCASLPSKTLKFSLSKPVTRRFIGSVIVTGTNTRSDSVL